jgi:hypothetical protein
MTAEIAIMNKLAIALAADSAVTIGSGDEAQAGKIFNSVNKLFALSKTHPVGIMIYGRADLAGVPWEILIKEYRKELGDRSFNRISQYADDFLRFLTRKDTVIPEDFQAVAFLQHAFSYLAAIKEAANKQIGKKIAADGKILEKEALDFVDGQATKELEKWNNASYLAGVDEVFLQKIIAKRRNLTLKDVARLSRARIFSTIPSSLVSL